MTGCTKWWGQTYVVPSFFLGHRICSVLVHLPTFVDKLVFRQVTSRVVAALPVCVCWDGSGEVLTIKGIENTLQLLTDSSLPTCVASTCCSKSAFLLSDSLSFPSSSPIFLLRYSIIISDSQKVLKDQSPRSRRGRRKRWSRGGGGGSFSVMSLMRIKILKPFR